MSKTLSRSILNILLMKTKKKKTFEVILVDLLTSEVISLIISALIKEFVTSHVICQKAAKSFLC